MIHMCCRKLYCKMGLWQSFVTWYLVRDLHQYNAMGGMMYFVGER
jgi:hypothetical protein